MFHPFFNKNSKKTILNRFFRVLENFVRKCKEVCNRGYDRETPPVTPVWLLLYPLPKGRERIIKENSIVSPRPSPAGEEIKRRQNAGYN